MIGLVSCTTEELPELSMDSVSIYAASDANHNSAIAVDLVLVYNQELLKTIGQMPAFKYFAASKQLLLDNPSHLDIWHWELVPGQVVEDFTPEQDKGDAYGAYIFANYLTPGEHRLKVAQNGIVKIILLKDDLKNLAQDVRSGSEPDGYSEIKSPYNQSRENSENIDGLCGIKQGPTNNVMQPCGSCPPPSPPCMLEKNEDDPCFHSGRPIKIITQHLDPPPASVSKPYGQLR